MSNNIAFLHPGKMGASLAAAAIKCGHNVFYCSKGRSEESKIRAKNVGMMELEDMQEVAKQCSIIISICPPDFAYEVSEEVIASGFRGIYVDANAISVKSTSKIFQNMKEACIEFVDGGIIGGPAWSPGTILYLSGGKCGEVQHCFEGSALETRVVGPEIGQASALKMCFAAYTKGRTALLTSILASAESLGVRENLEAHWSEKDINFTKNVHQTIEVGAQKAWRFSGEMKQISETLESTGMPKGFHLSACEIYKRLAKFKNATPSVEEVIEDLI